MLTPIKTGKLYQLIMEEIKTLIHESDLQPGDKIPSEREIAKELTVSRSSVRQAITALSAQGILDIQQGDGTFVSTTNLFSEKSLVWELNTNFSKGLISKEEIEEMKMYIECENARLCAIRASSDIEERLMVLIYKQRNLNHIEGSLTEINQDLHMTIAKGTQNKILEMLTECMYEVIHQNKEVWLDNYTKNINNPKIIAILSQHEKIVDAILRHEAKEAYSLMNEHAKTINNEIFLLSE